MNAGPTAERVYDRLKRQILCGAFRPGERLDPAVLATPLASSVTPVRDALHILTGEGLVDTRTGGGFHMPLIDEPALQDMYGWSADLLALALTRTRAGISRHAPVSADAVFPNDASDRDTTDYAERTAMVFVSLARRSDNSEHLAAVLRLNDRLHAIRRIEPSVVPDAAPELDALATACTSGEDATLRRMLRAYHHLRRRYAAGVVRRLYRAD